MQMPYQYTITPTYSPQHKQRCLYVLPMSLLRILCNPHPYSRCTLGIPISCSLNQSLFITFFNAIDLAVKKIYVFYRWLRCEVMQRVVKRDNVCTANGLWAGVAYMGSYGKRDSQLVSGRVLMDFTVDALINLTDPGWKMPGLIAAKHRFRINSILRASLSALPTAVFSTDPDV